MKKFVNSALIATLLLVGTIGGSGIGDVVEPHYGKKHCAGMSGPCPFA